jgi:hypothetical protein
MSAHREAERWKLQCEEAERQLRGYDNVFLFLCSHMERNQLCRAVDSIKLQQDKDMPLPPAVRAFVDRNMAPDQQQRRPRDDAGGGVAGAVNAASPPPVLQSAEALTKWASRMLRRQEDHNSPTHSSNGQTDMALLTAETRFKIRDLEKRLHSSAAIRTGLLTKAVEAEQRSRSLQRQLDEAKERRRSPAVRGRAR